MAICVVSPPYFGSNSLTPIFKTVTKVSGLGGNADHIYWTFCYDCSSVDVEVEGVLGVEVEGGQDGFRYINLQCYSWDSLPLNGFLDDETLKGEDVGGSEGGGGGGGTAKVTRKFKAYLTTKPSYTGQNEIDVRGAAFGTATLRLLLPVNDDVEKVCLPKIRAVSLGYRG